jgi:carbon storage regulator
VQQPLHVHFAILRALPAFADFPVLSSGDQNNKSCLQRKRLAGTIRKVKFFPSNPHIYVCVVGVEFKEDRGGHGVLSGLESGLSRVQLPRRSGKEMLVLSRKVGERILIGDNISITVVRITGGAVRIGVEAPPHLAVIRQELQDQLGAVQLAEKNVPQAVST